MKSQRAVNTGLPAIVFGALAVGLLLAGLSQGPGLGQEDPLTEMATRYSNMTVERPSCADSEMVVECPSCEEFDGTFPVAERPECVEFGGVHLEAESGVVDDEDWIAATTLTLPTCIDIWAPLTCFYNGDEPVKFNAMTHQGAGLMSVRYEQGHGAEVGDTVRIGVGRLQPAYGADADGLVVETHGPYVAILAVAPGVYNFSRAWEPLTRLGVDALDVKLVESGKIKEGFVDAGIALDENRILWKGFR